MSFRISRVKEKEKENRFDGNYFFHNCPLYTKQNKGKKGFSILPV